MDDELDAVAGRIRAALGGETGDAAAGLVVRYVRETMGRAARQLADGSVFLATGDIPAMWLRDSTAQVTPLLRIAGEIPGVAGFAQAVLRRQLACIAIDPYANAFNAGPDGRGHVSDETGHGRQGPWVWERKFEVDSLCYPVRLAWLLHELRQLTGTVDGELAQAAPAILSTLRAEQDHERRSPYLFSRSDGPESDTLARDGRGSETAVTGLVWSGFRPSDDRCAYGFHVPGNMFLTVALRQLAELVPDISGSALALRAEVAEGLRAHATTGEGIWAYEVDGFGNALTMDDANVPSLLALPLLGYCRREDPTYLATRAFILSAANPYYVSGKHASGIGSPHTPPGHVWPISIAVAALTDRDRDPHVRVAAIEKLLGTRGGTDRIHESFDPDDPRTFTRDWFCWAEAVFADLVLEHCGYPLPGEGNVD